MQRPACTHCKRSVKLKYYVIRATVRCPFCRQLFEYERPDWPSAANDTLPAASPSELRAESVPSTKHVIGRLPEPLPLEEHAQSAASLPPIPQLTSPHSCHQCRQPIEVPIGKPKATVECPACSRRTSIYAVHYLCGSCSTLLESPLNQAGMATNCPKCGGFLTVPQDVVEREPPDSADVTWFGFDCPSCSAPAAAKMADAGAFSVCPRCFATFSIPHCGHAVSVNPPTRTTDPREALQRSTERRCPRCGMRGPIKATACPYCGLGHFN